MPAVSATSPQAAAHRWSSSPEKHCREWRCCERKVTRSRGCGVWQCSAPPRDRATSRPRDRMAQEIEVKFALKDRNELVHKLHDIGAKRLYPETFEDNIVLDRRGELRTKGSLLRVRKFG